LISYSTLIKKRPFPAPSGFRQSWASFSYRFLIHFLFKSVHFRLPAAPGSPGRVFLIDFLLNDYSKASISGSRRLPAVLGELFLLFSYSILIQKRPFPAPGGSRQSWASFSFFHSY
jgi:hypothetical protein